MKNENGFTGLEIAAVIAIVLAAITMINAHRIRLDKGIHFDGDTYDANKNSTQVTTMR